MFAGIWLLLQGLSGFCLGFNPVRVPPAAWAMALLGIFARELLRAFLSALPKGLLLEGPRHCLRARTGGVPADRRHSQPSSAPVGEFLPTFSRSALLTALAIHGGFLPALLYGVAAQAMGLWIPVSPALSRPMGALLELVMNLMFLVALDCDLSPRRSAGKAALKASVAGGVAACTVLAALICFFAGLLPWQPVAVATGSMEPQISVGDAVLVSKLDTGALEVGDVIQFRRGTIPSSTALWRSSRKTVPFLRDQRRRQQRQGRRRGICRGCGGKGHCHGARCRALDPVAARC